MDHARLMDWGFFLITLCNILLIALVVFLLWQRYFPSDATPKIEPASEEQAPAVPEEVGSLPADTQQEPPPSRPAANRSLDIFDEGPEEVYDENYPTWKKSDDPYVAELLSHREALELKVDNMVAKLARAHKVVTGLRAQNRELRASEAHAQRLQEELTRTQTTLSQIRQERDALMVEVQHVRKPD
ncbi:hypothetical protein [Pseudomonas rhizoryzae]|uniref:hypothetical protein n=1 Tax=Pseudomonas rhizoryzae TaxID=2571129 RepID=UPI0007374572|nr:hypothetical protein [Pseudomonas rhizoryzae]KTT32732.1 hypothetical protein SB9_15160 [Pseudomonas psychrotolerans]KTT77060.1 hypothetical protein SB18R_09005 [Pseudomonas psychrotolerans]